MTDEQILTDFLRRNYSDENLIAGLAHAEDGKLSPFSCCCFVGIPTADHPLQGAGAKMPLSHVDRAMRLPGAFAANSAFARLANNDSERCALIVPIFRTEIERRERVRCESFELVEVLA